MGGGGVQDDSNWAGIIKNIDVRDLYTAVQAAGLGQCGWPAGRSDGPCTSCTSCISYLGTDQVSARRSPQIMAKLTKFAGPDKGWNDPCLLLSTDWHGNELVTENQSR